MENNIPKENKKGKSKKFYIISIAVSLLLVAVIIGTSYAYFTASVDNSNNEATVIKTGYMEIEFTDGEIIGTTNNMVPGDSIIKKFKVRNTGNVTTPYDVYFSEVVNTFTNKSDLVYTLRTGDSTYNKEEVEAPSEVGKLVDQRTIEPGEEQEYELEIIFKETGVNQDNNKGKKFRTKISINEYKDAKITVNYNANQGSVETTSEETTIGETLNLPTPTREGYDFAGWYSEETGGSQITNETEMNDDTTLYAHWSATNYTITYNLDNGTATNPSNYTIETEEITLNNPSRDGYDFVGWSGTDLEGTNNTNVTINKGSTGNKTYTANYTPKTYTITYNLNNGTCTNCPSTYTIETDTFTLPTPTRDNAQFIGWSGTDLTGEENTTVTINKGSTGNREYTVKWETMYNENGYNYWNNIVSQTNNGFSNTSAPAIVFKDWRKTITPGTTQAFMKTRYVNGSPVEHIPCFYYGPTDSYACLEWNYYVLNGNNNSSVLTAMQNIITNILGATVKSCSSQSYKGGQYLQCYIDDYSKYIVTNSIGYSIARDGNLTYCTAYSNSGQCSTP